MRLVSVTAVTVTLLFVGSSALQAADKSPSLKPPSPVKKAPPSFNLSSPPAALMEESAVELPDKPAPPTKATTKTAPSKKPVLSPAKKKTPVKEVTKTTADPKGTVPAVPASEALRKRMKLQTPRALTVPPPDDTRIGEPQVQPEIQRTRDPLTSPPLRDRKGMTREIPSSVSPGGNGIGQRSGFGTAVGSQTGPGKYSESEDFRSRSGPLMPGAGHSPVQGQDTEQENNNPNVITFTEEEVKQAEDDYNKDHAGDTSSDPGKGWDEIFTGDIGPENEPDPDDDDDDTGTTHADGDSTKEKRTVDGDTPDSNDGQHFDKGALARRKAGSPGIRGVPDDEQGEGGGEVNQFHDMGPAIMDPPPGDGTYDGTNLPGATFDSLSDSIKDKVKSGGPVIIEN